MGQKEHWPWSPKDSVLFWLHHSISNQACSPRHNFLNSKLGTVLPPLLLACPPYGAIEEDLVRQRMKIPLMKRKELYPCNRMPWGMETMGLG